MAKYRRKSIEEYPLGECEREGCGRKYRQTRAWQKFCSRRCRVMEWRKNHPQIKLEDFLVWLQERGLKLPSKT